MKKILLLFLIALTVFLSGCQTTTTTQSSQTPTTSRTTTTTSTTVSPAKVKAKFQAQLDDFTYLLNQTTSYQYTMHVTQYEGSLQTSQTLQHRVDRANHKYHILQDPMFDDLVVERLYIEKDYNDRYQVYYLFSDRYQIYSMSEREFLSLELMKNNPYDDLSVADFKDTVIVKEVDQGYFTIQADLFELYRPDSSSGTVLSSLIDYFEGKDVQVKISYFFNEVTFVLERTTEFYLEQVLTFKIQERFNEISNPSFGDILGNRYFDIATPMDMHPMASLDTVYQTPSTHTAHVKLYLEKGTLYQVEFLSGTRNQVSFVTISDMNYGSPRTIISEWREDSYFIEVYSNGVYYITMGCNGYFQVRVTKGS